MFKKKSKLLFFFLFFFIIISFFIFVKIIDNNKKTINGISSFDENGNQYNYNFFEDIFYVKDSKIFFDFDKFKILKNKIKISDSDIRFIEKIGFYLELRNFNKSEFYINSCYKFFPEETNISFKKDNCNKIMDLYSNSNLEDLKKLLLSLFGTERSFKFFQIPLGIDKKEVFSWKNNHGNNYIFIILNDAKDDINECEVDYVRNFKIQVCKFLSKLK